MAALCKLIALMLRLPPEARVEDVAKLYRAFSWKEHTGGKHSAIFVSPDEKKTRAVPTKSGRMVKTMYLKLMVKDLELKEYYEQNCQ